MSPLRGLIGTVAYGVAEFYRRARRQTHLRVGVLAGRRHGAAARGHHHGLREHGRRDHRRGRCGRGEGHRDRRRGQRQSDGPGREGARRQAAKGLSASLDARWRPASSAATSELDDDKLAFVASIGLNRKKSSSAAAPGLLRRRTSGNPAVLSSSTSWKRVDDAMPQDVPRSSKRALDPVDRVAEVLFD